MQSGDGIRGGVPSRAGASIRTYAVSAAGRIGILAFNCSARLISRRVPLSHEEVVAPVARDVARAGRYLQLSAATSARYNTTLAVSSGARV